MPTPGEHKTVQARILRYAEAIGWTIVSREKAEQQRGFDPDVPPADRPKNRSLYFDDLLDAKVREFNPGYAEGVLLGQFRHLHTDIDLQPRLGGCLSRAPQRGRISDEKLSYATPKGVSRQLDCFFVAYNIFSDI